MHLQKGLHFVWQFILLTKHISSHIPSHSVDKCMLSNTLFPSFDEKHIFFRFHFFFFLMAESYRQAPFALIWPEVPSFGFYPRYMVYSSNIL